MARGEKYIEIDCIETRSGWGFEYKGRQEDVTEAVSILENGS
ncbi:MAG TPA: hypothetical protein VJP04_13335 [Terriglobales bacterium]|nr:hypothetical protein [Terriglobales bacterium]